jgi:hypothetical protein
MLRRPAPTALRGGGARTAQLRDDPGFYTNRDEGELAAITDFLSRLCSPASQHFLVRSEGALSGAFGRAGLVGLVALLEV